MKDVLVDSEIEFFLSIYEKEIRREKTVKLRCRSSQCQINAWTECKFSLPVFFRIHIFEMHFLNRFSSS